MSTPTRDHSFDNLLTAIDLAFSSSNNEEGLRLLRKYVKDCPEDVENTYRLANVEEQLGYLDASRNSYLLCLRSNTHNWMTYLHLGYLYELLGDVDSACMSYLAGEQINPSILYLWRSDRFAPQTRMRSQSAFKLVSDTLTNLHFKSVGNSPNLERVYKAIWVRTHNKQFTFGQARQRPQIFFIPRLKSHGFEDLSSKKWVKIVEDSSSDIENEYRRAALRLNNLYRPYLDKSFSNTPVGELADSMSWSALDIYRDGEANTKALRYFPKTLAALEQLPIYSLEETSFEVFFSVLKSKQHIQTHYGMSNHSLTVHLPIHVPPQCSIRVGDEQKIWQKGKLLAFDDTFDHEARNDSSETRVVLIFSVWHPGIKEDEKEAIKASFRSRHQYIQKSKHFIHSLVTSHTREAP